MPTDRLQFRDLCASLRKLYGPPDPPSRSAWEWVVWENVAYLVDDSRRSRTYSALRREIGLEPAAIAKAPAAKLIAALLDGGMHAGRRAEKLRECAAIALGLEGGLDAALRGSPSQARRVLARFPGIGAPGAEKILLFTRAEPVLALESNGLRVLLRLGFGTANGRYANEYRSVQQDLAGEIGAAAPPLQAAHLLLRRFGQEVCTRSNPKCGECVLARRCPSCGAAG